MVRTRSARLLCLALVVLCCCPILVSASHQRREAKANPSQQSDAAGSRPDGELPRMELYNYNPVANPSAVVTSGNARFTVLTDRVVRMEYAGSNGQFNDAATLAVLNRALSVPRFTQNTNGGVLTIQTAYFKLSYTVGKPFTAPYLSVTAVQSSNLASFQQWTVGDTSNEEGVPLCVVIV